MKSGRILAEVLLLVLVSAMQAAAQSPGITLLNTDESTSLLSATRYLAPGTGLVDPRLDFTFGFATDETFTSGTFHDSFTISIRDSGGLLTSILLTIDASGIVVAPPSPGTFPISPGAITLSLSPYPDLQPGLGNRQGFELNALIPNEYRGQGIFVDFDLFNNVDGIASQGWFTDPQLVSVPEPGTISLLVISGTIGLIIRRPKK